MTYEIMTPESVGWSKHKLVLGKHSGRHAFRNRLTELGYQLSQVELEKAFDSFKKLADIKKEVFDDDLEVLVTDEITRGLIDLRSWISKVYSGTKSKPKAKVKIRCNGKVKAVELTGGGPVDAAFKAIPQDHRFQGRAAQIQCGGHHRRNRCPG